MSGKDYAPPVEKRGWEQGSVGWGVKGVFGDGTRDTGQHARAKKGNLVKDERGRWVKPEKPMADDFEERLYKKGTEPDEPSASTIQQQPAGGHLDQRSSRSRSRSPDRRAPKHHGDRSFRSGERDHRDRDRGIKVRDRGGVRSQGRYGRDRDSCRDTDRCRDYRERERDNGGSREQDSYRRREYDNVACGSHRNEAREPRKDEDRELPKSVTASGERIKINTKTGKKMRFTDFGWEPCE